MLEEVEWDVDLQILFKMSFEKSYVQQYQSSARVRRHEKHFTSALRAWRHQIGMQLMNRLFMNLDLDQSTFCWFLLCQIECNSMINSNPIRLHMWKHSLSKLGIQWYRLVSVGLLPLRGAFSWPTHLCFSFIFCRLTEIITGSWQFEKKTLGEYCIKI